MFNSCPVGVSRPLLKAMKYDELAFRENSFKLNFFTRILARHLLKIFDECFFTVRHYRIVLNVLRACVAFDGFSRLTPVEHEVVE